MNRPNIDQLCQLLKSWQSLAYNVFIALPLFFLIFSCTSEEETKTQQYFVEGRQLYQTHCANCHQTNGEGLGQLYPSLSKSAFINKTHLDSLACLLRYGSKPNPLNNTTSGGLGASMPANEQLEALDIAEILTFINIQWKKEQKRIETKAIEAALQKCH